ncbi:hypothetical protein [Silanimonas sp.]|jgi:hypothetical protein|uniref:hypothetical protein n=1 Tax=Silanimonas sp. TaxID=1929290 RepID=UPI0022BB9C79|nr:hypothetical protein [Silanimonas sp.]MCZ8062798.1 hypothetical protein [Silanimonas sp.]
MSRLRLRARTIHAALIGLLALLVLASSMAGALAISHPSAHDLDAAVSVGVAAEPSDCEGEAPHPPGLASLSHDLAHAWHHCGVVMAVLPMPIVKLLAMKPTQPPSVDVRGGPAPLLQSLFRPPIR